MSIEPRSSTPSHHVAGRELGHNVCGEPVRVVVVGQLDQRERAGNRHLCQTVGMATQVAGRVHFDRLGPLDQDLTRGTPLPNNVSWSTSQRGCG